VDITRGEGVDHMMISHSVEISIAAGVEEMVRDAEVVQMIFNIEVSY